MHIIFLLFLAAESEILKTLSAIQVQLTTMETEQMEIRRLINRLTPQANITPGTDTSDDAFQFPLSNMDDVDALDIKLSDKATRNALVCNFKRASVHGQMPRHFINSIFNSMHIQIYEFN